MSSMWIIFAITVLIAVYSGIQVLQIYKINKNQVLNIF